MRPDDGFEDDFQNPNEPGCADTGIWPAIPASEFQPKPEPVAEEVATSSSIESEVPATVREESSLPEHMPIAAGTAELAPRLMAAMSQMHQLIEERLGALQTLFDREVRAEATRERIVDRLHAELQEYKQDLLLKVQRPIFIDLIQLHDDLGKMIESEPADEADRSAANRAVLESVRTAIEDILYRHGVEPFRNEAEEFDPRRQRAVTTVATDDAARNKTIAARIRPGFQAGDKLIRPEFVTVYTHKK